ncbi:hypothetical protein FRC12_014182 [Ceratobasidium sp. 428]|nr:hypothetical protein FRC09_011090 [Ceratobasidium sp. 395]KAG8788795.1 hypothetical protein FRC12_014182 [Ceratobasidium sp. 428]
MPRAYSEYHQVFRLPTLQRGRPTALELSPSKRWLCSATDNGDLMVLRSTYGRIYFHVGMGRQNHVTKITWATDVQIILGCVTGAVYTATLAADPSSEENRVKITKLLHDEDLPICALAWNSSHKILAVGYSTHVSIWRRILDERPRVWETVDEFDASSADLALGQVHSLWFSNSRKSLIVGLETGTIVWFSKGNMISTDTSPKECRIGAASLSFDNSIMAVSTRDQSILIWPFLPDGPITSLAYTYRLESGREWHKFESRTPVTVTQDRKVVCGTLDGTISVLTFSGFCLQRIKNGASSCISLESNLSQRVALHIAYV